MNGELKACPFCGGRAERIDFGTGSGDNEGGSCIACTVCQSSGPVEFGYKENFISTWNTRPTPAPGALPELPTHDWRCTNCRSTFAATDNLWKKGFGRLAPVCPRCKAYNQYTYPIGVSALADIVERMGFTCEAGPLQHCVDWIEIRKQLRAYTEQCRTGGMNDWRDISTAPRGDRRVILLISVNGPNGYITDPWTGWVESDGRFARWPHDFPPTHWKEITPKHPALQSALADDEGVKS